MVRRGSGFVLVLALLGCSVGSPWSLDPDAAHIVPPDAPHAAYVVTEAAPDSMTPGVEGSILFVRLIGADGRIVLDRGFDWPSDQQAVPPGEYTLLSYWRTCDGHCGNLSPESPPICQDEISLTTGDHAVMHVIARNLSPGSECTIEVRPG